MARISIFLVAVALIAGMVGCFTPFRMQYQLTISSTEGGKVTAPGEGIFTYWEGTTVNLVAEAEQGYCFGNWTGDVSTIGNVTSATTNITMNCDYSITANFAPVIEIWDWYDLDAIRNDLGSAYILMNNLDSSTAGYEELASPTANGGKGWQPIGSVIGNDDFAGTFDGQGYEIRDLFINRPDEVFVGLFAVVEEGGVVEDIGVVNVAVTGEDDVGGLVGVNGGGTVSDSYSTGNVTGEWYVGGLVGATWGTVSNSYSTGNATGEWYVGGLVGGNAGIMSNSYSTGFVTGNSSVGGLVGENDEGTVSNSFWDTETSGQATSDGGTGKNTTEMQDITTFSDAGWDIVAVGDPGERNLMYIWNIVDAETYPFLSWQS